MAQKKRWQAGASGTGAGPKLPPSAAIPSAFSARDVGEDLLWRFAGEAAETYCSAPRATR